MKMALKSHHLVILLLGRWSRRTFPYSSCKVQLKSLDIASKTTYKHTDSERWREESRPIRNLWIWGTAQQWFPWVFFCFIHPRVEADKASNLQTPTGADKKAPVKLNQSLLSLVTGQGKGQSSKTENFKTTSVLQPNTTEKTVTHSHLQRPSEKPRLPPWCGCHEVPHTPTRVMSEKAKRVARTLITTGLSGDHVGTWTSTFTQQ